MKKSINDIIEVVINTAWEILDYKAKIAMGRRDEAPENYEYFDFKEQEKILRLVQPLLSTSQQTKKISAETSQDIVKLIKLGKVSLTEAKELMALTGARIEVEEKELKLKMQQKMMEMLNKDDVSTEEIKE